MDSRLSEEGSFTGFMYYYTNLLLNRLLVNSCLHRSVTGNPVSRTILDVVMALGLLMSWKIAMAHGRERFIFPLCCKCISSLVGILTKC